MYKFVKISQFLFHPLKFVFTSLILNVLFNSTFCYDFITTENKTTKYSYTNYGEIDNSHEVSVLFNRRDYRIAEKFVRSLKHFSGNWASHGIQRVIRLNSDCSNKFVSLRNLRIRADIPSNEAFTDPYTLIEQQVYRNVMALKSKQTNKYVCYNSKTGYFVLKNTNELDRYCIFFYNIKKENQYTFSVGSNKSIFLSFNKIGRSINSQSKRIFPSCPGNTNLFNVIAKSTDYVKGSKPPIVIVYESKKPIKSYSLKNGYQSIFYSTLEQNYITKAFLSTSPIPTTTTITTTTTSTTTTATTTEKMTTLETTLRNVNIYEFLSKEEFNLLNANTINEPENLFQKALLGRKLRRNRIRRRRRRRKFFRTSTSNLVI